MPLANWLIWDRIREFARSNRIYQQERILQDQSSIDRIAAGGEFLDFNSQTAILQQTNLQINRLERYKDYEQMDQTGEISLALDLYADELSLIDPEHKHSVIIRAGSRRIKEELEDLYYNTLLIDRWVRPAARYLCKFGDAPFEIVADRNRNGVSSVRFMNVYNFTRIETRFGDLVGYFYQDDIYPDPIFLHPWACLHLRLTSFENIFHPYGRSLLDGGRKAFKQLRLMEDGALIYRITRAPEKRKYKIPVGMIPPKEVPEYMLGIARMFKRNRFYNPTTGTFDERYSPIVQEDDFFLPQRPDGTGPDIDTLPGAENLDQIADIEYFKKKMVSPLKIPFSRVGIGQDAGGENEKSLSQSDAEFAKAVQWIQSEIALGLQKIGIVHLALRGYPIDDIRSFNLSMASSSALDDLYRMETWQTRTGVMSELKDIGWFPKEWIVTRFTDLSADEIEELEEMSEEESGGGEEEGGGGGGGGGGGMGGDMGGDMGDDMGGDEGGEEGDAGAEEGGEAGGEEEGEAEVPDEAFDFESADQDEERLILEVQNDERRRKRLKRLKVFVERRGKATNAYKNLLESKELDGLSKNPGERKILTEDYVFEMPEEVPDDGLLVGWSVPKEERESAINEIIEVIGGGRPTQVESDDITAADLPNDGEAV